MNQTIDERITQMRKNLLGLAVRMLEAEESESAIALIEAERAVLHAFEVMSNNGIDVDSEA